MTDKFNIGTNGKPIDAVSDGAPTPTTAPSTKVTSGTPIKSIVGNNLGSGHGVYAGSNVGEETVVDYRTIVAGEGISIETDSQTITITNTGVSAPTTGGNGPSLDLIRRPVNLVPADGATTLSYAQKLRDSIYRDVYGVGQQRAQFVVSTDPACAPPYVLDVDVAPGSKPNLVGLADSTQYFWKVRHQDQEGLWSNWSAVTSFTTSASCSTTDDRVARPSIITPSNNTTDVELIPLVTATPFAAMYGEDTIAHSSWEVKGEVDDLVSLIDAPEVTVNPTQLQIPGSIPAWEIRNVNQWTGFVVTVTVPASNGDVYMFGGTTDYEGHPNVIMRCGPEGNIIWQKYTEEGSSHPMCCGTEDFDGNLFVVEISYEAGPHNIIVTKMSGLDGSTIWQKAMVWTDVMWAEPQLTMRRILADIEGNLYLSGSVYAQEIDASYGIYVKCDSDLNIIWQKQFNNVANNVNWGELVGDGNGNNFLTSLAYDNTATMHVHSFDRWGQVQWTKVMPAANSYRALTCKITNDGVLIFTGLVTPIESDERPFLLKMRTVDGLLTRYSEFSYSAYGWPNFAFDDDANMYITSADEDGSWRGYTYLTKYDSNGTMQWRKKIHGAMRIDNVDFLPVKDGFITMQLGCWPQGNIPYCAVIRIPTDGTNLDASNGIFVEPTDFDFYKMPSLPNLGSSDLVLTDALLGIESRVQYTRDGNLVSTSFGFCLDYGQTYYVRVRYNGTLLGDSDWSDWSKFTTKPVPGGGLIIEF